MTKKYTHGDVTDLVYEAVEEAYLATYPETPPSVYVTDLVTKALFAEGIFDPNQVEGA